jgi:hypothetical protein
MEATMVVLAMLDGSNDDGPYYDGPVNASWKPTMLQ